MPALTTQKIIMGGNAELMPRDVQGNVLSLIANKANNGLTPSSLTTTFKDLSPYNNNCTLNNLGGTAASGFNSEVNANSRKTVWFLRLDGTDDYGAFANTTSLDITTNEFALACTFRITAGAGSGYLLYKGLDSGSVSQYYMLYSGTNKNITLDLNSNTRASLSSNSILENVWYNIIFYRNASGLITPYINKINQSTSSYATALVTQPNMRLGARSNNAGGTTHATYLKGDIATQSIYQATKLDIAKIIKAEMNISKAYTGVA